MADLKISQLTDGGGLQPGDELAVNRGGASYKARGVGTDGWISDTAETWTYVSATSFKVAGTDVTVKYSPGTRIRLKQAGGYKYFVVGSSSFSTDTTVTITGGNDYSLANAAITDNYHSYAGNPQGYPGWFSFTPFSGSASGWGSTSQNEGHFCVNGRTVTYRFYVQGTSNSISTTVALPINLPAGQNQTDVIIWCEDNGVFQTVPALAEAYAAVSAAVMTVYKSTALANWTASGTKLVSGVIDYPI